MKRVVPVLLAAACGASSAPATTAVAPREPPAARATPTERPAPSSVVPTTAAVVRTLEPLTGAPCVVTDRGDPMASIVLRAGGKQFASISEPAELELRANESSSTLHAVTARVELTGEVVLGSLVVRPRERGLQDGWLDIGSAWVDTIARDTITVAVWLPDGVTLVDPAPLQFLCASLSLVGLPEPEGDTEGADGIVFRRGVSLELRRTPRGAPFATLRVPAQDDGGTLVTALERKGRWTRIRIDGGTVGIVGWVPNKTLRRVGSGYGFGTIGVGTAADPEHPPVACPDPVPVYVHAGADVLQVGAMRPNARIDRRAVTADETEIYLGISPEHQPGDDVTMPFVRTADVASCPVTLQ